MKCSLHTVCRTLLFAIAVSLLLCILILNVLYTAEVSYNAYEKVSFSLALQPSILTLLIAFFLSVALAFLYPYLGRLREGHLFFALCLIYTVMAIYLLLNTDASLRADAYLTYNAAKNAANGNFADLAPGGYIHRYPHQVGLMLYDRLLLLFSENVALCFVLNFIFVIGNNFLTARIAGEIFASHTVNLLTILLSFLFFPQFFFIMFAYGLIPGFFFMTLAFYFAIRFSKVHRFRYAVGAALAAAISAALKQNFLIGAIAVALYLLLDLLHEKGMRRLLSLGAMAFLLITLLLPTKIITAGYEAKSGMKLDEGTPTLAWVVMGTDIDNWSLGPGWYTAFNYNSYTESGYNTERAEALTKEALQENIRKIQKNPEKAAGFFLSKTVSQWCEPMFQSLWSGPLADCGQNTHTPLLQSLYSGGREEDCIQAFSKSLLLTVIAASVAALFLSSRKSRGWELSVMFFIGGLLFHTAWEAKSQYTYPYIFVLLPLAAYGIVQGGTKIRSILERILSYAKREKE